MKEEGMEEVVPLSDINVLTGVSVGASGIALISREIADAQRRTGQRMG